MANADLHNPVMEKEMLTAIQPADGEVYVDATFGAGGYSRALLEAAECRVYAIDRDPNVVMLADALARDFPGRFLLLAGCFGDMVELLAAQGVDEVDGVVMDIGVSSMQLDQAERGFSFMREGPLDMRMSADGVSAETLVNTMGEKELADILYTYGEERASRRIARAICDARLNGPIQTTTQLSAIVHSVMGKRRGKTDSATKTFQALRIAVNDELGELERALKGATKVLRKSGRLVVVTFHSLEDRMVKRFFAQFSHGEYSSGVSRHAPAALAEDAGQESPALFEGKLKQTIKPDQNEMDTNPRARSAKLRVGHRTDAPVN